MRITPFLARLAARFLAALALTAGAATTTSTDYSDLWWNPAESGWGAGLYQQNDVIFMTIYIYGPDGRASWFVAPDLRPVAFILPGDPTWHGTLYRVTGPWFGGPFDPAAVRVTAAGEATLAFPTPGAGTLSYTADGASVTKAIRRQSWRQASIAGPYRGGMSARASGCDPADFEGIHEVIGAMDVTQSGDSLAIAVTTQASNGEEGRCNYTGRWSQDGRLGAVTDGSYYCTVRGVIDNVGTFTMSRVELGRHGFYGRWDARDQYCRYAGQFGGTRREGP